MELQPERGQFTHDARDRFTHDQIGKGHVGVESIDPDTQEKTRTMIHDPPTDPIAAQDHQNKHTGHELRAAKESGNHSSSDSQGGGHHVERVVTNTGSYMMEKDTGEQENKSTDKMQQQSNDMEQQQSGNGEELRGRIGEMMEESGSHFSRGTSVGYKQEQH